MKDEEIFENTMRIYPPGCYEKYILNHFVTGIGFDLSDMGKKLTVTQIPINTNTTDLVDLNKFYEALKPVSDFLHHPKPSRYDSVIWYKINVVDQFINEYTGIGLFFLGNDYLKFIHTYSTRTSRISR